MKFRSLLCAALGAALLASSALAADAGIPAASGPAGAYTIEDNSVPPIPVWGSAASVEEGRVELKNSDGNDPYSHIVVTAGEDTLILDAVTGEPAGLDAIRAGDTVYAYVGPAMTRSMPPIAHAALILCNIPADYAVPIWAEVQGVTRHEDGTRSVLMSGDVVLHLSADTEIVPAPGVTGTDIAPGARLLSWYSVVAQSLPAQAAPEKVMVFSNPYGGWLLPVGEEVSLNGRALTGKPFVLDGRLMLPLREVSEALGYTVNWEAANPELVSAQKDGQAAYALSLSGDTATLEGDMVVALSHKPAVLDGVTYLCAEDVILLHNLKLAQVSPF